MQISNQMRKSTEATVCRVLEFRPLVFHEISARMITKDNAHTSHRIPSRVSALIKPMSAKKQNERYSSAQSLIRISIIVFEK